MFNTCCVYTVIRGICDDYELDFGAFYACIGLWNSLFLIIGGVFNLSLLVKLFKRSASHAHTHPLTVHAHSLSHRERELIHDFFIHVNRSIEEVIALFISVAFVADAVKGTVKSKSCLCLLQSQMLNAFGVCFYDIAFPRLAVFHKYYHPPTLANGSMEELHRISGLSAGEMNLTSAGLPTLPESFISCTRARPLLFLLLMLGTLWVGYTLYQFKRR